MGRTLPEISAELRTISDEIEQNIAKSLKAVRVVCDIVDAMDVAPAPVDPHWLLYPFDQVWPVTGEFGMMYDIGGKKWQHEGIDFGCPVGCQLHACAGGVVEFAGWRDGYGNCVVIRHVHAGGTWHTWYGHLSSIGVVVNQVVIANQVIGLSGATGNVTGAHLHLTVQWEGSTFLPSGCAETLRGVVNPREWVQIK
jgi:murein DD-endopeptidase MepM/ murein hydrolase activator NlpD